MNISTPHRHVSFTESQSKTLKYLSLYAELIADGRSVDSDLVPLLRAAAVHLEKAGQCVAPSDQEISQILAGCEFTGEPADQAIGKRVRHYTAALLAEIEDLKKQVDLARHREIGRAF